MEIELLQFKVIPEDRTDEFIEADGAVRGPWLTQQRGYLRKMATVYPGGIVHLRVYWDSKKNLKKASESVEIPALDVKLRSQFLGVFQRLQ